VGHKLLAVSLSDIAAMGGKPVDAVVAISAQGDGDAGYVERIYNGLYACADRFGVSIVGGDTTHTPGPLVLSLTLTGEMVKDQVCYRSGAQAGDVVYVSGTLGDAAGGLGIVLGEVDVEGEDRKVLVRNHHRPEPRVDLGQALAETNVVTAMIDVSDGVASDLGHICISSGVSALIWAKDIPMSPAFVRFCEASGRAKIELALTGGEDFELLFCVNPAQIERVEDLAASHLVHQIGEIVEGDGDVMIENKEGTRGPLEKRGYDHFG